MGYALPSTQVKNLCDNILANQTNGVGMVKVARFGIEVTPSASTPYYDANGNLRIREEFMVAKIISANSAAYNILKVGDVFESMSINDGEWIEFKRQYQINDLLLTVRKGDVVKLKIKRDGSEKTVSVNFDKDNYFEVYR
jgi:S1-C subfamily serine protease